MDDSNILSKIISNIFLFFFCHESQKGKIRDAKSAYNIKIKVEEA